MFSGRVLLPILISLLTLAGCTTDVAHQPNATQETIMAAPYQTDIAQLSQFINLPAQPA